MELYRRFSSRVNLSFGIGTRLTCDIPQVKPLNIVPSDKQNSRYL